MDNKLAIPGKAAVKLVKFNSALKCINSGVESFAVINRDEGRQKCVDIIVSWIIDLNEFLNISRKMNESQIKQTADLILSDFYYMNIADINLVISRAKKGYYGKLFESLDGMKIYQWFNEYSNERAQEAFNDKLCKHDMIKQNEKANH